MSDSQKKEELPNQHSEDDGGASGTTADVEGGNGADAEKPSGSKPSLSRRNSLSEKLQNFASGLLSKLSLGSEPKPKILEEPTIDGVVKYIQSEKCKNIIIMAGAGISTAAGIPDFRSPESGLYANIQKDYDLPDPQAMFEIGFFRTQPEPFYKLAKQLFPEELVPTISHHFVKLCHDKGYLLRHYTQNIDGLERIAEVPGGKIVEAHGSFHTAHCIKSACRKQYSFEWMKESILKGEVPKCTVCSNTVKPDVVFFGENLPARFFSCAAEDFPKCDLLIIMGTSLVVQPFAYLVNQVTFDTPRVLINREIVGKTSPHDFHDLIGEFAIHTDFGSSGTGGLFSKGMDFKSERHRDVAILGDCDEGVLKLSEALGWKDDLLKLVEQSKTV